MGCVCRPFCRQTKTPARKAKAKQERKSNQGLPQGLAIISFYIFIQNTVLIKSTIQECWEDENMEGWEMRDGGGETGVREGVKSKALSSVSTL